MGFDRVYATYFEARALYVRFAVCYGYATLCLDVSYCVHGYAVLPLA